MKSLVLRQNGSINVVMDDLNPSGPTLETVLRTIKTRILENKPKSVAVPVAAKYRPARLIHHNYDLQKRWYVIFYAFNTDTGSYTRKRIFEPLNRKKTVIERLAAGTDMVEVINAELRAGKTLGTQDAITDTSAHNLKNLTIMQALDYMAAQKKLDRLRKQSLKRFATFKLLWQKYFDYTGSEILLLKNITPETVTGFFQWLQSERKIGNKTFNNYRADLSTFFRWCMKRDPRVMKSNPVENIGKLKAIATKHSALSDLQMKAIKDKCIELGYTNLLLFITFIYNTFARPGELRQLKIRNIEMAENRIFIPGSVSKNNRDDYVPISPELRKAITESGLLSLPEDYFIFGYGGSPGMVPCGIDYFYGKNSIVLNDLNITGRAYSVYSYKHSGVISLYRACLDIKLVQRICRHQTLEQTNIYLRDLGLHGDYDGLEFWK